MRYCPNCRRINEGWPERCRYCGLTWGVRFCRRGHPNPASAVFCGECGSGDMTETAHGGRLINLLFRIFRGRRIFPVIRLIIALTLPFFALGVTASNLDALLPIMVAIAILIGFPGFVGLLRFGLGLLPRWLTGGIRHYYKDRIRGYMDRAHGRDNRGN